MFMSKFIQLNVPNPCNNKWDEMVPNDNGRHCKQCNKTVVDFSNYTTEQLLAYFRDSGQSVCGRIGEQQLANFNAAETLQPAPKFHFHTFVLTAFLSLGSVLKGQSSISPQQSEIVKEQPDSTSKYMKPGPLKVIVKNVSGEILPYVGVYIYNRFDMLDLVFTDSFGIAHLSIPSGQTYPLQIKINQSGYLPHEIAFNNHDTIEILLSPVEVVQKVYTTITFSVRIGLMVAKPKHRFKYKVKRFFRRLF